MANLLSSRWAPSVPGGVPKEVSRMHELHKCDRLFRRLKWKSSLLSFSHQRATRVKVASISVHEAQVMFKVDFFEFYLLLERLLVQLLGIFRIPVKARSSPPGSQNADSDGETVNKHIVGTSAGPLHYHRFHAEVLRCLDEPSNPLHTVLGTNPVRAYLQTAKDFRNEWKDAAETSLPTSQGEDPTRGSSGLHLDRLVEDLDLANMLEAITEALESARGITADYIKDGASNGSSDIQAHTNGSLIRGPYDTMDCDSESIPWEAMPDCMEMDWE